MLWKHFRVLKTTLWGRRTKNVKVPEGNALN